MADGMFSKGREKFLRGEISWNTDTIKVQLIDTGNYTPSLGTHEFLSAVPSSARIGAAVTLASKTTTDGVADAADVTFTGVTGNTVEAYLVYKDTGVEGSSALIAWFDSSSGLPLTPNGGNVNLTFDNGAFKIFKL